MKKKSICLSSARMTIECAFGRLKARFSALRREMDLCQSDLPNVIYSCFVLHNFCEMRKEKIPDDSVHIALQYDKEFQPPGTKNNYTSDEEAGKKARDIFKMHFNNY